jgi:dienelactone hydrolase
MNPSVPNIEEDESARRRAERREIRAHEIRRRRMIAVGVLVAVVLVLLVGVSALVGGGHKRAAPARPTTFAVGLQVLHLSDPSRTITLPSGASEPRPLLTYVRYPALGVTSATDVANAPAASAYGPFPLVVFGHGFAHTPNLYQRLLQAWTRAGYVVAAPAFPLTNQAAPGGPNEEDLTNQPADMSFIITSLLNASASPSSPLHGLINPAEIAVSGHSDGGDTALAAAYEPGYRDRRVGAAVILSGAEIPAGGEFAFPAGGPPLLATQGTADKINLPTATYSYFAAAQRPKYLLKLIGSSHIPPYTYEQPRLSIVENTTIAFMDAYLKRKPGALRRISAAGQVPGVATLQAEP